MQDQQKNVGVPEMDISPEGGGISDD